MSERDPRAVAAAVSNRMGGASADAIMANHRGPPRAAELRAYTMLFWREQFQDRPTLTEVGQVFGRDRRNVARGLARIDYGQRLNRSIRSAIERDLKTP